ncbi:MAG: glycosyltransferase family 4 protein [Candidatus Paceibacterota bacterium]|jgi:glycosyltransferase involved in cell wall biosynthesis
MNNMRKILIFSLVYYPRFIGGAEVAIKEITDRISPDEVEFDMVTLRKHAPAFERIGNVNVYRVGLLWFGKNSKSSKIFPLSKYLFIFFAYFKALKLHRKNKYDAIWSIMANYAGFSALFFKNKNPEVPFILTLQEGDPFDYIRKRVGIFYSTFKKIFTKADYIQTLSNYLADWARDMGAKCPITVVPNAVDYEHFSKPIDKSVRDIIRSKDGFTDSDIVLITTSRLVKKNAVNNVISALQYLPSNVKFLILGKGYEEENLKSQISDLKLTERVQFLGFIPHEEMPKYLQASDIFIRPSLSEGFGNSFLEAMAAGIPVITTQVGGIPDFLKDGETGLFCEVNNPKSIAQKVEKLIKDKESREYIVRQAREMVKNKYTWEKTAGEMKKILRG